VRFIPHRAQKNLHWRGAAKEWCTGAPKKAAMRQLTLSRSTKRGNGMEDISAVGDTYDGVVTRLARLDPRDGRREGEPKRQEAEYLLLMAILPCLLGPKIYARRTIPYGHRQRSQQHRLGRNRPLYLARSRRGSRRRCHSQSIWS
jgi:hypothetical protein